MYQECVAISGSLQVSLDAPIEQFTLLNQSGCVAIDGLDDAAEFRRTKEAMVAIGMDSQEQDAVVRTLAAVLLLAQLEFEADGDDHAHVAASSRALLQEVRRVICRPITPGVFTEAI
jgi:myosin heavy subunit